MESLPLVSIICLCHNQKTYVGDAIRSVFSQTWENIELIVVDDGSRDGSKEAIRDLLAGRNIRFIDIPKSIGNCAAFNRGFRESRGEYLIDLAADDILLPKRVEEGINDFANAGATAGVHFCDAFIISEAGDTLRTHYARDAEGQLLETVPQGDVYKTLIERYYISPPTMMFNRLVLEDLGGYDESLAYEDFDFWIRSSRKYHYVFNRAPLVKKRQVRKSHGAAQFTFRSKHLNTTLQVCQKIVELNRTAAEDRALIRRCNYEIRQCLRTFNLSLIPKYQHLKQATQRRLSSPSSMDR